MISLASAHPETSGFWPLAPDPDARVLQPLALAKALAPALVAAAQAQYDEWDESDVDTYAGGGICHLIADAMVGVLDTAGITATTVSSNCEQHVYVACVLACGVYTLDIHYSLYERGGGFRWTKIQGVTFDEHYLTWYRIDADPGQFEAYLE